jgi:hypothetical protein
VPGPATDVIEGRPAAAKAAVTGRGGRRRAGGGAEVAGEQAAVAVEVWVTRKPDRSLKMTGSNVMPSTPCQAGTQT